MGRFGLKCAVTAAALLWAVGCRALAGRSEGPVVWACGESVKVSPDAAPQAKNSVWNGEVKEIRLFGARQEYVGFQVVTGAGAAPLADVQVQVALKGPDGRPFDAGNVDLFRQHYLRVTVPSQFDNTVPVPEAKAGEFPVQMVPLRGKGFTVPAGRSQPVWVDLYLPENQAPGEYSGEVRVTSAGKVLAAPKLRLTVWRFTLPRETHLKTMMGTGPEHLRWGFGLKRDQEDALRALEDRCFQMAHQHRLNFNPSGTGDVVEEWGGRWRKYLDGSAFKERAGPGVGQNLLMTDPGVEHGGITPYLKKVLGWWKREKLPATLAVYVFDEPHSDEDFAEVQSRAALVRATVGKEIPIYLTTTKPGRVPGGLIDIWGEVPADQIPTRQARGEKFLAVNQGYALGPYVDTPGYAGRSQAWMAWKMKLDGWHFWDCCYWTDRQNLIGPDGKRRTFREIDADPAQFITDTWTNPLTFDQKRNPRHRDWIRINGDGVLFYPGTPAGLHEPLASFTMKSLRRGLQDYEYLWLLREKGKPADDIVDRIVPRANAWSRTPDEWDEARLELGRRLDALAAN